ncbi:YggS family pyridoxal phosphate-dependent enzyme [Leptospira selangorensis]|uniref:Pyridoxal phosphate homeostasis protein n=1 Tax=Leptospira selangorensis TaxID=2484982 RepID=A0A5F2C5B3_9LEPT|nr:YggS family pyridoxal phosphate-dependent enzyme [Leptospira selangorensis]TGM14101.1 YggS family pyridoxal phosphate-dependent enzyme [Leptospira selangorensis]TGM26967.1 YggS family pyridoxal phosphate-dependent enzyme [Leptospira selangorensis]
MGVSENYRSIVKELESLKSVGTPTLIAVSKFQPKEKVQEAISGGVIHFGENRVQEGIEKFSGLGKPEKDFILHHIGPVQSSHIRKYAGLYSFVHGVGSEKILEELKRRMNQDGWKIRYFLQVNLTEEDSKSGFSKEEVLELLRKKETLSSEFCVLEGFMTMGPSSGDPEETRKVFQEIANLRKEFLPQGKLSMGMSGDYRIALEEGSDYLRIGTAIFGERT